METQVNYIVCLCIMKAQCEKVLVKIENMLEIT